MPKTGLAKKFRWQFWETLTSRRRQHKLTLYYKMTNYLTPAYLSSLLPPLVGAMSRYPLRNSEQYQTIDAKSQLYYNSFLPSTIREWNTQFSPVHQFLLSKRCQRDNLFQIIIISLAAETNRYFMLELGQIVAVCITPYSVKTSYKTSSVHVAKLKTSSISSSLVQGSLPSVKLC